VKTWSGQNYNKEEGSGIWHPLKAKKWRGHQTETGNLVILQPVGNKRKLPGIKTKLLKEKKKTDCTSSEAEKTGGGLVGAREGKRPAKRLEKNPEFLATGVGSMYLLI